MPGKDEKSLIALLKALVSAQVRIFIYVSVYVRIYIDTYIHICLCMSFPDRCEKVGRGRGRVRASIGESACMLLGTTRAPVGASCADALPR